jgi:hypothetical protein
MSARTSSWPPLIWLVSIMSQLHFEQNRAVRRKGNCSVFLDVERARLWWHWNEEVKAGELEQRAPPISFQMLNFRNGEIWGSFMLGFSLWDVSKLRDPWMDGGKGLSDRVTPIVPVFWVDLGNTPYFTLILGTQKHWPMIRAARHSFAGVYFPNSELKNPGKDCHFWACLPPLHC